jgi:hypothetical protein
LSCAGGAPTSLCPSTHRTWIPASRRPPVGLNEKLEAR